MTKEPYCISFSGGRTSAYMTKMLLDHWSDRYEFFVTFANTGLEHPKTLEFIHNCDKVFGFNTVWIEAVVHHGERIGNGFKVVTYETASRNGEPFESAIAKYGVPNAAFPQCTSRLKLEPMAAYRKHLGLPKDVRTAIGIRADESRRVKRNSTELRIEYPLVDEWPIDKEGVLLWWEDQPFDLEIEEFEGNCLGCWKKSKRKLFMQIDKDPSVFDWHKRIEAKYSNVGRQPCRRVFFRNDTSTEELFVEHARVMHNYRRQAQFDWESGGCSESCEVFETEDAP